MGRLILIVVGVLVAAMLALSIVTAVQSLLWIAVLAVVAVGAFKLIRWSRR